METCPRVVCGLSMCDYYINRSPVLRARRVVCKNRQVFLGQRTTTHTSYNIHQRIHIHANTHTHTHTHIHKSTSTHTHTTHTLYTPQTNTCIAYYPVLELHVLRAEIGKSIFGLARLCTSSGDFAAIRKANNSAGRRTARTE